MNSTAHPPASPRGRLQLVLLATLFFFPLLISYGLYYVFPELRPSGSTNFGQLINPAQPLPALALIDEQGKALDQTDLYGRWTYVVFADANDGCAERCLGDLVMLRQVRLAMNEKRSRVQRVLVLRDTAAVAPLVAQLKPEHPDLRVLADLSADGARLQDFLQPAGASAYLIDPLGNWLLVYQRGSDIQTDFRGFKKDLSKLLRLSRIG
ncbi:MAG: SCO family protein [Panacagrimonas sp.]